MIHLLLALALPPDSLPAAVVIPAKPTCGQCRIVLTPVATLGEKEHPGAFVGFPSSIVQDGQGRYFVTTDGNGEPPWICSAGGKYVGRVGRAGSGPGEYPG
ncbi:MAG: hypothetical protein ACOY71_08440, partial [Gemmatimonadota bacterium]